MITNWFAFILVVLVPMLVIIGMGTVLLVTYIKERRSRSAVTDAGISPFRIGGS